MAQAPWTRRRFVTTAAALAALPSARAQSTTVQTPHVPFLDAHVHVWKHDPALPFATGANPPVEDRSAEMLLQLMRANDVQRTVIVQVIHYKWDNRYLAGVLRRYRGTFEGVCRVNPEDPAAPDALSRLTEEDGFHGVRLSPAEGPAGDWIRGPLMPPLWCRCAELKVPMTLLIPVTRLPEIHPLIEANPGLQVVIDHMADCPLGRPDLLKLLLELERYPNVFVKATHLWTLSHDPYPYPDAQLQVRKLYDVFGARRLMAGTDWPISLKQLEYAQTVRLYRDFFSFLTPQDRVQMLAKTARQVWPFAAAQ